MNHTSQTTKFGKISATPTSKLFELPGLADKIATLKRRRIMAGKWVWWSATTLMVCFAVMVCNLSSLYMGYKTPWVTDPPSIMVFGNMGPIASLSVENSRLELFDLFANWSSRNLQLASWMILSWGGITLIGAWVFHRSIHKSGAALIAVSLVTLVSGKVFAEPQVNQEDMQRFALLRSLESELDNSGLVQASTMMLQSLGEMDVSDPQFINAARPYGPGVSTEALQTNFRVSAERLKFVAAQYWTAKGDVASAKRFLPLDLDYLPFNPGMRAPFAERLCWLFEQTGVAVDDTGMHELLCQKASLLRGQRVATSVSRYAALGAIISLAISILFYLFLTGLYLMIRTKRSRG